MRPIERSEILPLGEYETIRERFRSRVIEEKRARRVRLGEHLTVVFENRDTVLLQVQEMLRTERITTESSVQHEIDTYNELIPGDGQLSVTLFVEIPDRDTRERMLEELVGLEERIALEVDGERFRFEGRREGARPDRTTAVHYLKVALSPDACARIRSGSGKALLVVDHPRLGELAELSRSTVMKLADDLMPS